MDNNFFSNTDANLLPQNDDFVPNIDDLLRNMALYDGIVK
jgi:hypothetical protein